MKFILFSYKISIKMESLMTVLNFIHNLQFNEAPSNAVEKCKLSLLYLIGVVSAGRDTKLSAIICNHASEELAGRIPISFCQQKASARVYPKHAFF